MENLKPSTNPGSLKNNYNSTKKLNTRFFFLLKTNYSFISIFYIQIVGENADKYTRKTVKKRDTIGFSLCCPLSAGLLEVGNKIISVLSLLKTTEGHLGSGNVLLGVLEVLVHGLLVPLNTLLLVGLSVRVTRGLTGGSAENTVEVRSDLVGTTSLGGVALETSSLEEVGTLLGRTWRWKC